MDFYINIFTSLNEKWYISPSINKTTLKPAYLEYRVNENPL